MNSSVNPYAAPASTFDKAGEEANGGVWRSGKVLVLRRGANLPHRCLKCNAPATPGKPKKLYWHHWAVYLLVFINILIYIIVGLLLRKTATVALPICDAHRRRRFRRVAGALLAAVAMVVLMAVGEDALAAIGIAGLLIALLAAALLSRLTVPVRIDAEYVRLKGCGQEYLDSLPSLRE